MKTLKLYEVSQLDLELKDLIKENLTFKVKYWLDKLLVQTSKEVSELEKTKNEYIMKYGEENKENGAWAIAPDTEAYTNFVKDYNEVLEREVSLDVKGLSIEDFKDLTTTKYYGMFYRILDEA